MDVDANQRLDYLYREYVRLSDKAEDFIKGAYEDFKLFGVVGAVVVLWKPISEVILSANPKLDPGLLLFLGFLSLLAVFGMIGLMNLIKQSYTWYYVYNLQIFETEIRKELGETENSQLFSFNLGREETRFITAVYRLPFRTFVFASGAIVILIPFIILCFSSILYAVMYLLISSISFFTLYLRVFRKMLKQFSDKSFL